MIIFALLSTGAIEICYGADVDARVRQLEEAYDEPVKVLAVREGDEETKLELHQLFAHLRFDRTQQFRPGSELLEFIDYEDQLWDDDGFNWSEPLQRRTTRPRKPVLPSRDDAPQRESVHPDNGFVSCEDTRKTLVNPLDLEGLLAASVEVHAGRLSEHSVEFALFGGLLHQEIPSIDAKEDAYKRFAPRTWHHLVKDLVPDGWSTPGQVTRRRDGIINAAMWVLESLGLVEIVQIDRNQNVWLPFRLSGFIAPTLEWHIYARFHQHFPFIEPPRPFCYQEYLTSEHWDEVRRRELRFARYACRLCGSKDNLQVHHRSYENLGYERSSDVIVLCGDCHHKFHQESKLADDPNFAHSKIRWNGI